MTSSLHEMSIVIDGLIISDFGRPVFEDMRRGGLTAANCTCCVWETFTETMRNVMRWKTWFREHGDILKQVYTTTDILKAKEEGKTGIILGWQNVSGIEDQIGYLSLFKELGIGIMQMAYNTQNLVGSGCYESSDGGLSDFGHDVVAEMNRLGILCDLSHVGAKTSEEVIRASKQPVAYSHCLPAGLKAHPRNKSDAQLRFIVDHGGFVGVTMFPPFLKRGPEADVGDYVEAIEYVIDICGGSKPKYTPELSVTTGQCETGTRGRKKNTPSGSISPKSPRNLPRHMFGRTLFCRWFNRPSRKSKSVPPPRAERLNTSISSGKPVRTVPR